MKQVGRCLCVVRADHGTRYRVVCAGAGPSVGSNVLTHAVVVVSNGINTTHTGSIDIVANGESVEDGQVEIAVSEPVGETTEEIRKGLSDDFLVGGCQITIIVLVCLLDVTGTNPLGIKFFRNLLIILIDTIHFIHVEGSDGLSHLKDMVAYRNGLFINQ